MTVLFLWAAVALLAVWFVARKVGAQGPAPRDARSATPRPPAPPPPAPRALPAAAPAKPVAPAASAAPVKEAAVEKKDEKGEKKDEKKDEKKSTYEEPVDYAVAGPEGGVPVHPDGVFRSPFAHPHWGPACNVRVGILIANVRDYDIQKGSFEADFFFTYTSDIPMPPMDPIFTNGKMDLKEVMADLPTFKMYRFIGNFSSPLDLHDFPFDTQELKIEIEDDDNGTDQVKLLTDKEHTNLDVGFEVAGWETAYTSARILTHYFPDRFDHDDMYYSRFEFCIGIKRFSTSAMFTVFMPALVIVLISLSGLWLPRSELEVRANATVPMLAAAVLFHFALMQELPATAYLTRADKLMMSVYLILGFHMTLSWLWFMFDEKHEELIMKIGKYFGAPVTFIMLFCGIAL